MQLTTVRFLGVFLDDPTDVPAEVLDYLAEQLDVGDSSVLKAYGERENTRLEHAPASAAAGATTLGPAGGFGA